MRPELTGCIQLPTGTVKLELTPATQALIWRCHFFLFLLLSFSLLPRPSFLPLSQLGPPFRIVFAFWQKAEKGGKCGETFKSED